MIKLNCWNDFDNLKSVILGSVYENDRIPIRYTGEDQENFIKIVEETNRELENYQKILEQNGVIVYRPKQPKNYNGNDLSYHDPTINMRDFFITYGNIFFTTYGPYKERRFQHFWIQDILSEINKNGNLIVNSPEINLDGGFIDYQNILDDAEYFELTNNKNYYPNNFKEAKKNYFLLQKKEYPIEEWDYFLKHSLLYRKQILFHTASVLKRNKKAYISTYGKLSNGHIWFENWLKFLDVEPIYIPKVSHIDGSVIFLNNETVFISQDRWNNNKIPIENYFSDIKNFVYVSRSPELKKLPKSFAKDQFNPTLWYNYYRKICLQHQDNVNCLVINPNKVLLCFYDKDFYLKLKNIGIEAIYVKWSNAKFWEGNLHCITCELERSY
jgi:N-dimethylarginine dimethylaminohydrolase